MPTKEKRKFFSTSSIQVWREELQMMTTKKYAADSLEDRVEMAIERMWSGEKVKLTDEEIDYIYDNKSGENWFSYFESLSSGNIIKAHPISFDETKIETWFERDRAAVELRTIDDTTIVEWLDDDVQQAIEDGFLNPRDYHRSAFVYAEKMGLLPTIGYKGTESKLKKQKEKSRKNDEMGKMSTSIMQRKNTKKYAQVEEDKLSGNLLDYIYETSDEFGIKLMQFEESIFPKVRDNTYTKEQIAKMVSPLVQEAANSFEEYYETSAFDAATLDAVASSIAKDMIKTTRPGMINAEKIKELEMGSNHLKQAIKIINDASDDIDEIFIRPIIKKEKGNPTHRDSFYAIPEKEGYQKVYKPYGNKGEGYYYVSNEYLHDLDREIVEEQLMTNNSNTKHTAQQMKPELVDDDWVEVDGPEGTEWVLLSDVDEEEVYALAEKLLAGDNAMASVPVKGTSLEPYLDASKIFEINVRRGWFGARMTMGGYIDATPWHVFPREEQAKAFLKEEESLSREPDYSV